MDFNIQRLGLWLKYNQKSAISKREWEDLQCKELPELTGKLFAGIKFGHDGDSTALSIAVKTADGRIFVEAIDCRPMRSGSGWILDFLSQADVESVIIDGANGQELLAKAMKERKMKLPTLPTVKEIIMANAAFTQALYQKDICHMGQPSMVQVVSNCEKRAIGSNGGYGFKTIMEGLDISLMDSMILAYWKCSTKKEKRKQQVGY